jgi:RNA polymerase sigma-70 factor (ECF subfamily)
MDEESALLARLVAKARAGDPLDDDFRGVFRRFYPPVYCFFRRRGFSEEEGRDLTQETFLRVYRSIGRFRGETDFRRWLLRIAANLWKNELRRRGAGKRDAQEVSVEEVSDRAAGLPAGRAEPAHEPDALAELLTDERTRLVRRLFSELPPQMRRCVVLRIDQQLKYREIASLLQLSIETVKSQLHQARQRLRDELGRHFAPPVQEEGAAAWESLAE